MTINHALQNQVRKAKRWLAKRGVTVTEVRAAPKRAIILVDQPCPELQAGGQEIQQTINGLRSRIWAARLCGCVVVWGE
ncbi:hypothetical protein AN401_07100 [Zobellella denitrificans]|uniref:Uncharacterized protein n=1 Tax=Zobellella denitrificans TaxID=347534 RepID=A0A291HNK6_9GAMM|nr:hypothetical protein [Zobellella denitrificans]ATG73651.1 hypothetical protein AN401_07100 [Zobellella denitrificans]